MATPKNDSLSTNSHPDIVKRVSLSGLIVSAVLIVLGIVSFVATTQLADHTSTASMGLLALGSGLILVAIVRLVWRGKELVYAPTGSVTKMHTFFFDLKDKDMLKAIIQGGSFAHAAAKSAGNGTVRMDVTISEDKKFAAVQLFQFVGYTYEPVTAVQYFTSDDASHVALFLAKCKEN